MATELLSCMASNKQVVHLHEQSVNGCVWLILALEISGVAACCKRTLASYKVHHHGTMSSGLRALKFQLVTSFARHSNDSQAFTA